MATNAHLMIYNKNTLDGVTAKKIINLVGEPYSLKYRLKNKDLRSSQMKVHELSVGMSVYFKNVVNTKTVVIEMRPNGIVVHLNATSSDYAWCIPFFRLSIYKSDFVSIHAEGKYIKLELDSVYPKNKNIVDQLVGRRSAQHDDMYG